MNIRPATIADYDALCELFEEVDALHRAARPDIFRRPDGPVRSRERVAQLTGGEGATILVAERGDGLLGLAVVMERTGPPHPLLVPRRVAEIGTVVVREDARRQGVGRALIEAALAWAKGRGADDVEISVHAFNESALRAYAAAGFEMSVHRLLRRLKQGQT